MKRAPTDEVSEAQKKASGDPKPFDIFAGLQGEAAPPSQASAASAHMPFDVFAGMPRESLAKGAEAKAERAVRNKNDLASANLSFAERHPRFFVYAAIAVLALVVGVFVGIKLAR